ncbi:ribosome assembly protein METTL17, mitochondrial-like [Tubulanus polymorphus]|uniref:ribosome assembly protein METTL17, mitochondrial-like n=1 Tax=Tubulanus polymorphus TaxID=672921 RepID=UPI003DA699E5
MNMKRTPIPVRLQNAINTILRREDYHIPKLKENSETLMNFLHARQPPTETEEIQKRAREIESQLSTKNLIDAEGDDKALRLEMNRRRSIVQRKLRRQMYHWQPVEFDAAKAITYMVTRMIPEYCILYRIFSEMKKRQSEFKPHTLFDFGSGVGSVAWAANEVWPKHLHEHYCVDSSSDMNTLFRLLVQDAEENKETWMKGLFQKQFFPQSHENKYSLVVSAYSLFELPNRHVRRSRIVDLWQKTEENGFLVFVENGTNAGFKLIIEARRIILQEMRRSTQENSSSHGHIFSPCPHEAFTCPMTNQLKSPCNFEIKYEPLEYISNGVPKTERFSYVVFRKGHSQSEDLSWPRIIRPVSKPSKHVHCRICSANGKLEHHVLSARLNGKDLYKCARKSDWGDLLPATDIRHSQESSSDQLQSDDVFSNVKHNEDSPKTIVSTTSNNAVTDVTSNDQDINCDDVIINDLYPDLNS